MSVGPADPAVRATGWRGLLLGFALLFPLLAARGHMLNMTRVNVVIAAGELSVDVDIDLSLLLGNYSAYRTLLEEPAAVRDERLVRIGEQVLTEIRLQIDGAPLSFAPASWQLPDAPPEQLGDQAIAAMTTFRFKRPLAPGARELSLAPPSLAKIEFPVAYTFSIPADNVSFTRWLELPGSTSRILRLPVPAVAAPASESMSAAPPSLSAADSTATIKPPATPTAERPPDASDFTPFELKLARSLSTVLQHLRLGFRHIFPQGTDHVLFVLGLFLLAPRWRPLLSQTTAFTLAHTTTLGLAAYGIVSISPRIVEPLIALSIAYVAVENIWRPKLTRARLVIVFSFGLLHGLGFASSLSEVPMPRDQFFTALFSFNLGVDLGQLAVIAAAFLAVGWFRKKRWYRTVVVIPACAVIASIGAYWAVARTFF